VCQKNIRPVFIKNCQYFLNADQWLANAESKKTPNMTTPNLRFLTNRPEIMAEQRRLGTRNLLSEAIDSIHEYHDRDPDGAHIVTKLDDTDEETLLVGSAVAGNLFFDFGILVELGRIDEDNLQGLYRISEEFVSRVFASKSGQCECGHCGREI
jgi:hypothetical protein